MAQRPNAGVPKMRGPAAVTTLQDVSQLRVSDGGAFVRREGHCYLQEDVSDRVLKVVDRDALLGQELPALAAQAAAIEQTPIEVLFWELEVRTGPVQNDGNDLDTTGHGSMDLHQAPWPGEHSRRKQEKQCLTLLHMILELTKIAQIF
eukprot:CAMPEP_0170610108 /NCGR_PEP_ID=MMETSP0224-20130122/22478_1 /TAXON_ID=285029 /ORGANISM="Togula jolla, Strain CCCM 725" /LENGTH=147 /DNA_ID=CAMNT_0010935451 /DNA_START=109 /DNA_END=553 /DNA_ORIENTATION=-